MDTVFRRYCESAEAALEAGAEDVTRDGDEFVVTTEANEGLVQMLPGVLDEVRAYGPALTVVVLGDGAGAIEAGIGWHDEIRVRNHEADRGLSSSLQVGIDAVRALPEAFDGAFIVLSDQPLLQGPLQGRHRRARGLDRLPVGRIPPRQEAEVVPEGEEAGASLVTRPAELEAVVREGRALHRRDAQQRVIVERELFQPPLGNRFDPGGEHVIG